MIPVKQAPEPAYFDAKIRQPGRTFLDSQPDKEPKPLWAFARDDMCRSYRRMCAYHCRRIVGGTIDHFLPKSKYPALTYEWSNYRLCSDSANRAKGAKVGLLDPFKIRQSWFAIALPQCDVVLGEALPTAIQADARFTIRALNLNAESLVEDRAKMALDFCEGNVKLNFVKEHRPFLAAEIERQGTANGPVDEASLRLFIAGIFRRRKK